MYIHKIELNPTLYISAFADRYDSHNEIEKLMKENTLFLAKRFRKASILSDYIVCYIKKDLAHKVDSMVKCDDERDIFFKEIKTIDALDVLKFALLIV